MACACRGADADKEGPSTDTIGLREYEDLLNIDRLIRSCHDQLMVRLDRQDAQLFKLCSHGQTDTWSHTLGSPSADMQCFALSPRNMQSSEHVDTQHAPSNGATFSSKQGSSGTVEFNPENYTVDHFTRSSIKPPRATASCSIAPCSETNMPKKGHSDETAEWLADLTYDESNSEFNSKARKKQMCKEQELSKIMKLVSSFHFEAFYSCAIAMNGFFIGLEVQWQARNMTEGTTDGFKIISDIFALLFFVELLIRIAAEPYKFFCGCSKSRSRLCWNYFDIFLVSSSVLELLLNVFTQAGLEESNLRIIRIVRITRLCRLLRMARILRLVKGFRILVLSIVHTFRCLAWAMILLFLIIYVFAIAFTQSTSSFIVGRIRADNLKGDSWKEDESMLSLWEYCGTMERTIYTLFMVSSEGRSWGDVAHPIGKMSTIWLLVFVVFIGAVHFAVLNVVTGVFCQSAIDAARRDREMAIQSLLENKQTHVNNIKKQFRSLFNNIDGDTSGHISIEEFDQHIHDEKVSGFFVLLDIDTSDAFALFRLLDDDGSGEIDAEEFVEGCLRLQGVARSIDLAKVRHENKFMIRKLASHLAVSQKRSYSTMMAMENNLGALQRQMTTMLSLTTALVRKQQETIEVHSSEVPAKLPVQKLPVVPTSSPKIDLLDMLDGALARDIPLEPRLKMLAASHAHAR